MPPEDFARYVATLGRGPGRSRALTRDEARQAFAQVLAGDVDPYQVGAFLMLLRYRGEDAQEIAGLVEAAQAILPVIPSAELDWPSYGAGRTRNAPWFLLAALALGQSGIRVLMHGSNAFGTAMGVTDALVSLGLHPSRDSDEAAAALGRSGFAYMPIDLLSPEIAHLLGLRRLFGLRSPVNTVARLLNPSAAAAGIDGVFHPQYIDVHLGVAEILKRRRLLVLKGGGGEAERTPRKAGVAFVWDDASGRCEIGLPSIDPDVSERESPASPAALKEVWCGEIVPRREIAIIHETMALAMIACRGTTSIESARDEARRIWNARVTGCCR
ncbi:MAG TPA: glycosyl transferase family protein [Acetobacteraceae bacterium]|nr:glycosyl transferase family protein [Acetobacteraceae bacterium]